MRFIGKAQSIVVQKENTNYRENDDWGLYIFVNFLSLNAIRSLQAAEPWGNNSRTAIQNKLQAEGKCKGGGRS